MTVPHGKATRYKTGCRCNPCKIANTEYERERRRRKRGKNPPMPVLKMPYDTLTRGEFMKYRYGDDWKESKNGGSK